MKNRSLETNHLHCDYLGSGLSPIQANEEKQKVAPMTQDALSIMEKLELDLAHTILVGHSMGAMVACDMASKKNNKFAGLVLLGPVHPTPGAAQVFAKRIQIVEECMSVAALPD